MNTAELLQAIRQRAMKLTDAEVAKGLRLFPPASTESVQLAESKLGFSLPSFLKDVYTQVGNGGFGPGYGIIGTPGGFTDDGNDIAGVHQLMSQEDESDPQWVWPVYFVPICDWGCAIRTCVDAFTNDGAVFTFDPNGHEIGEPIDKLFARTHDDIASWFQDWVNGVSLWDVMFEDNISNPTVITNPFTGKKTEIAPKQLRGHTK